MYVHVYIYIYIYVHVYSVQTIYFPVYIFLKKYLHVYVSYSEGISKKSILLWHEETTKIPWCFDVFLPSTSLRAAKQVAESKALLESRRKFLRSSA